MQLYFLLLGLIYLAYGSAELPESAGGDVVDVFTSGEDGWKCYKIPTLFVTHSDTLLAFAEARGGDCMDWQDTDLVVKSSIDGGDSWGPARLVVPGGWDMHNVAGNIAIVQDRETGRIHLPFTIGNIRLYHCYSDDLGETWSEPVELTHITSYWEHWVGFGPPSGLQTSSGRLLLPAYSSIMPIYDNGIFTRSFFVYSDDNGATWHRTSSNIPTNGLAVFNGDFGNEAEVVEVKPGLLLVNSRAAYGPRIQSTSTDDGLTWSAYSDTAIPQPVLGCEGSLLALGDGSTVLFSGPNTNDILRVDLGVWESGDEGESYELAWEVDFDLSATVGYSSMVRMNSGETKILWGRAMTVSEFFVPDYISIRSLPPSLWGEPRDTAGYVSPSGETQDMSWVSSKSSYKYSETFSFYALAASNFLLTGLQCVWGLWKVLTFLKGLCCRSPDDAAHLLDRGSSTHVNKSDLGLKAPSCLSRWCGCCCLPFLTFIFVVVSVVGTAAQWVFKLDDGERWQRQSLNVLVWNGAVVLLLVAAHVMRRGEKEEGGDVKAEKMFQDEDNTAL